MDDFYTAKEFKQLREDISNVVLEHPLLKEYYYTKKTSYKMAKTRDWRITIEVLSHHGEIKKLGGLKQGEIIHELINAYSNFRLDELTLFAVTTRNDYGFHFSFIPTMIYAKILLQ